MIIKPINTAPRTKKTIFLFWFNIFTKSLCAAEGCWAKEDKNWRTFDTTPDLFREFIGWSEIPDTNF